MKSKALSAKAQKAIVDIDQDKYIDHILEFNPLDASTSLDTSSLQPIFLVPKDIPDIKWERVNEKWKPTGKPLPKSQTNGKLPMADFLVVTWTVAEALALSDALTPGFRSTEKWYKYKHNWLTKFKPMVQGLAPSLRANRLGSWFLSEINNKSVLCFKSELHMCRDGKLLPVKELWKQLIEEVQPSLVITTGTAGGIGKKIQLGDVIVSQTVRFDCNRLFKNTPFKQEVFTCKKAIKKSQISVANKKLFDLTKSMLPDAKRSAKIIDKAIAGIRPIDVVTTDFFAFDDYKLQGLGAAVEMGDATLALACKEMGDAAPAWVCIRNASDPQISGGLTLKEKYDKAGRIYEKYGYWTTINSAIACWSIITSF
jgi:nucleoside phosphorylase